MLSFAKSKIFIAQYDLEAKAKTFKVIGLKVKRILMFNLDCIAYDFSLYTFIQHRKIYNLSTGCLKKKKTKLIKCNL